ncbi:MAG: hypothetical protein ACJ76N_16500 [Thermoanaerobaculia bacterium]
MTQIQIELPDEVAVEVKRRAERQGVSAARFVTKLVEREVGKEGWPKGFFEEVVGGWQGEPLERPAPLTLETREEL